MTVCSSKLCCIRLVLGSHGGIYLTTLATGLPSITAFAVGKGATSGSTSGTHATTRLCTGPPGLHRFDDHAGPSTGRGRTKKTGGQEAQALGRSRGGFATKLHAACSDEHTGGCLILTSGARHDAPGFALVWHDLPTLPGLDAAVMDKAYDSDAIRQVLQNQGVEAVLPSQTNRSAELPYAKAQYKCRQIVERFFNKLKHFRRIATRYDKLSRTLLAFIHLVATWMIIR
jgi:transposase